ncbi:lysylphosphatidylglycerol synthase transmembrane domain-containing protein [Corynebacterium tapiri]|uniref:UPF0104 family protein n=1 Tax=Corynebacterium tapiri TaxID=1448266 RepID=A0A5C4U1Z8_9CORY|nr:YbhN family protein [Corynebacterium tapiri]TNL94627.1 UPF0104 family protein [Corynebacterium tapiri]
MTRWGWARWLAPLVVLALVLYFFRDNVDFIAHALRELRSTHPFPLALGLICACASLLAMGEVMRLLIRAGGTRVSLPETTAITLASNAWSTTVPGGPAFSAVLTFQVQRSWGATPVLCSWFLVISSIVSTMWLALIGLVAILLGASISLLSLVGSLAAIVVVGWLCYAITAHPESFGRSVRGVLRWIGPRVGRGRDFGDERVRDVVKQLRTVRMSLPTFAAVAVHSLLNRLFDAAILALSVWAVTGNFPALHAGAERTTLMGVLLAYITAKIAGSAQVTPAGLGTVEAAIVATLVATGMTAVNATSAAIIYRLVSFLFVTLIGWGVYFLHYGARGFSGRAQADADDR